MQIRRKFFIKGRVQGVGFRPAVYKLARGLNLNGLVFNTPQGVTIEVEGDAAGIENFIKLLKTASPPQAEITDLESILLPLINYHDFKIAESVTTGQPQVLIPADLATCPECFRELFENKDRRFKYPFLNCTRCGPRFTIIEDLPYDRKNTTMNKFNMCQACEEEYKNPDQRRFHAEPNACGKCGPQIIGSIKEAVGLLKAGKIVALKGLGGFQLACDATRDAAVQELRRRKKRPAKPFALMSFEIEKVQKYCHLGPKEREALESCQKPIVLLSKKENIQISKYVAPNHNYLGVMLPYTPLHYLVLKEFPYALVMTSGNKADEPIAKDNQVAWEKLKDIADYFLLHDRLIFNRCDDSIVRVFEGNLIQIRRSRGYVPEPIRLSATKSVGSMLAVGAELKNTFCLTRGSEAYLSQYIGDLDHTEAFEFFEEALELFKKVIKVEPEVVVHDLHPDYLTTRYAKQISLKSMGVQHHHAHIAAVMAEHQISEPVMGVAFDGLGYGTDGNIWGGEFMIVDKDKFERVGHLKYHKLPGGDLATLNPWRMAFSYLYEIYADNVFELEIDFRKRIERDKLEIIRKLMIENVNCPLTSSAGRFFDAVASLIGIRDEVSYEAQAALEMEMLVKEDAPGYDFEDEDLIIKGIVEDLKRKSSASYIASRFHETLAEMISKRAGEVAKLRLLPKIVLTGGVFQNRVLLKRCVQKLRARGLEVYYNKKVPTNDGGISLGQAWVANSVLGNSR